MPRHLISIRRFRDCRAHALLLALLIPSGAAAQAGEPERQRKNPLPEAPIARPIPPDGESHRFWDRRNLLLFAGVAAARALDYHSTGNMRRRGRDEILLTNEIVDNKPAFVAIQAAGTLTSIGVSYLFHRAGRHRLERWTSYIHMGVGTSGAVRNYCLKSHPLPPRSP